MEWAWTHPRVSGDRSRPREPRLPSAPTPRLSSPTGSSTAAARCRSTRRRASWSTAASPSRPVAASRAWMRSAGRRGRSFPMQPESASTSPTWTCSPSSTRFMPASSRSRFRSAAPSASRRCRRGPWWRWTPPSRSARAPAEQFLAAMDRVTDTGSVEAIRRAREVVADVARDTQVIESRYLSRTTEGRIALKAENLQRTGSFKVRGALNKISSLDPSIKGVVTGSAGNHGQSLAYAARARGLTATIFMPERAALAKVAAAEESGAEIRLSGDLVDDCVTEARAYAEAEGLAFVHPFDDPAVVAGQGTIGLELLEEVPDLSRVLVPVGGGGLIAGIATAVKESRGDVEVIGVESHCSLADGIAIKHPGAITAPLIEQLVDEVVTVDEDSIAEAIMLLLERTKLVVEGAGAVGVAALRRELVD